jgi:LAO/AO transport system kinase
LLDQIATSLEEPPLPVENSDEACGVTSRTKPSRSLRVGIAGPPGAGKSTLVESLGMHLTETGLKVAVLAVDPSSSLSGGSLLGDKTRMPRLSRNPAAFVRPSPTKGQLGGVTATTNEVVSLCEAAQYDVVLVETVGLGQSEVTIDAAVDVLMLILPPAGGDELQGVKRGIMEVVDMVVVNKADGDLVPAARKAAREYYRALHLLRPKHDPEVWLPKVLRCSALYGDGVERVWSTLSEFWRASCAAGLQQQRRATQAERWMWEVAAVEAVHRLKESDAVHKTRDAVQWKVRDGAVSSRHGAQLLLRAMYIEACEEMR